MKIQQRIYNLLVKHPIVRQVLGLFLLVLIINIAFVLGKASFEATNEFITSITPRESYFDYQNISYKERRGNSLVFVSTRIIKRDYPLLWNDTLYCNDGNTYEFFSRQETSQPKPSIESEYKQIQWQYHEEAPIGKECYLVSTIIMTVNGQPKIQKYNGLEMGKKFIIQ